MLTLALLLCGAVGATGLPCMGGDSDGGGGGGGCSDGQGCTLRRLGALMHECMDVWDARCGSVRDVMVIGERGGYDVVVTLGTREGLDECRRLVPAQVNCCRVTLRLEPTTWAFVPTRMGLVAATLVTLVVLLVMVRVCLYVCMSVSVYVFAWVRT